MSRTVQRLIAAIGLVAAIALVISIILSPDAGTQGDSIQRITALNIRNSSAILGWTYVGAVINLLICVYLCWIVARVTRSEPVDSMPRILGIAGAVGFLMFGLLNKVLEATLAYDAPRHLSPALVAVLFDTLTNVEFLIMFPLALVVFSVSITALRSRRLPRALCWVGFPLIAVQLVSSGGLVSPAGGVAGIVVLALLGTVLWLTATSVTLILQAGGEIAVRPEAPATVGLPEFGR